MHALREYIRLLLEEEVLGEPDMSAEEERDDADDADEQAAVGGGNIAGVTTPLGTGPTYPSTDRRKKKLTKGLDMDRKKKKKNKD